MIPKEVKDLLEAAYYSGWGAGQGFDSGYVNPDAFEDWWVALDQGLILSSAMHLKAAAVPDLPEAQPGTVVSFKQDDFVVTHVAVGGGAKTIELVDKKTYGERNRYSHWS